MNRAGLILAALTLGLGARQAHADLTQDAGALLSDPETALGGAIIACAEGAVDPASADAAFAGAGWTSIEDYEGTTAWEQGDVWVSYWTDPGFCMVADEVIGTDEMEATLLGLTDTPPATGKDEDGCTTFDLGPVTAALTSSGNDPTCMSDSGAALRFQLAE